MRVLYFYRDDGVHDRRFLDALGRLPVEVFALQLEDHSKLITAWEPAANVHRVHFSRTGGGYPWYQKKQLGGELRRIFQENRVDVVHAGPVDLCAWLAASSGLRPLVSMSWGYDLLVNAEKNLINHRRVLYTLLRTNILLDDCQAITSKAQKYGFPPDRIVTFPWGVDLQVYHPREVKNGGDTLIDRNTISLLSTRTMEKLYGCEVIIEAFIKAAGQEGKLRLIMLGDGSQKPRFMQRIEAAGLNDRVHFAGNVPEDEMVTYFHASDVYISASHSDGSSVSLLQAMACGLPVIVSDIPGNREWVSTGRNGWLFTDGNSDELSASILEAACSQEQRSTYSAVARKIVVDRADWQKNSVKLMDAYYMAVNLHHDGRSAPC